MVHSSQEARFLPPPPNPPCGFPAAGFLADASRLRSRVFGYSAQDLDSDHSFGTAVVSALFKHPSLLLVFPARPMVNRPKKLVLRRQRVRLSVASCGLESLPVRTRSSFAAFGLSSGSGQCAIPERSCHGECGKQIGLSLNFFVEWLHRISSLFRAFVAFPVYHAEACIIARSPFVGSLASSEGPFPRPALRGVCRVYRPPSSISVLRAHPPPYGAERLTA